MQYASLTGFVKTLVIIFIILMTIRYITKVFMPYVLSFLVKKSEDHINRKFQEFNNQQNASNFNTEPKQEKNAKKKVGEYIDFEEID